MKTGLKEYLRAAFNARPLGMPVPPNWLALAGFALLGLLNAGFWLLGAGLELAYLYAMLSSSRFRRLVDALQTGQSLRQWQKKLQGQIDQLTGDDQARYRALESRCTGILEQQRSEGGSAAVGAQAQGLSRLLWIYLRLLLTRHSIRHVMTESSRDDSDRRTLQDRIEQVKAQLAKQNLPEELRKSLTGQMEILVQRQEGQGQARQKLTFLEAELTRIQEQAELIREQAVLTTDPMTVSQRIDAVAATLGDTTQWIREQQKIYGQVEDLLAEPPPIANLPAAQEEKA